MVIKLVELKNNLRTVINIRNISIIYDMNGKVEIGKGQHIELVLVQIKHLHRKNFHGEVIYLPKK